MERKFRITVDGRPFTVTVEDLSEESSRLYPGPGSMSVQAQHPAAPPPAAELSRPAAPPGPKAESGDVVASLGGVVAEIVVAVGQSVAEGDRIIVIETMKMKTPLVAERAGTVKAIHVETGQGVEPGQVLVTFD